jgi:hypothetical protein
MDQENRFNPLKNVALNLQATGPAAIVCVWLICVTLLSLFASDNSNVQWAQTMLSVSGGAIMTTLAFTKLK